MDNLKVEYYILFSGLTKDLSLGDRLSDSSEGLFQRGKGYIGVSATKTR